MGKLSGIYTLTQLKKYQDSFKHTITANKIGADDTVVIEVKVNVRIVHDTLQPTESKEYTILTFTEMINYGDDEDRKLYRSVSYDLGDMEDFMFVLKKYNLYVREAKQLTIDDI